MEQENFNNLLCRLCFNLVSYTNSEIIEDVARKVLEVVLPSLNFEEKQKHHMCKTCCSKLFAAFNFKSTCMGTEDIISPHINFSKVPPVDLKEVYLTLNGNILLTDMWENQKVCRLCFQPVTGFMSINEVNDDIIDAYLSEVNISVTKDPVICRSCFNSLCTHGSFVKNCIGAQEKYKDVNKLPYIKTEDIEFEQEDFHGMADIYTDIDKPHIKSEEIEFKQEDCRHMQEIYKEIDKRYIKSEEIEIKSEEGDKDKDFSSPTLDDPTTENRMKKKNRYTRIFEGDLKREIVPTRKDALRIQMYKCDACDYEAKHMGNLKIHQLLHKDPSKVQMYKCDVCTYETKYKRYLKTHQLTHKDSSEVLMYECDICTYKSKYKSSVKDHQLLHKDRNEISMYKCDTCTYETKYKRHLKIHHLKHEDPSENNLMYGCDKCSYKTKRKDCLKSHQLIHKDSSEIQMYKCDICTYETKYKNLLKYHQLTHKDPSDIQMYTCDTCGYATIYKGRMKSHQLKHKDHSKIQMYKCDICTFQTKYKKSLKDHLLLHKDPSEIQMYKCDTCTYETKYKGNLKNHYIKKQHKII